MGLRWTRNRTSRLAVVFAVLSNIEDLIVDFVARRFERADNGITNVEDMHQRTIGTSVAVHPDRLFGPRKAGEIVQNDVEPHAW